MDGRRPINGRVGHLSSPPAAADGYSFDNVVPGAISSNLARWSSSNIASPLAITTRSSMAATRVKDLLQWGQAAMSISNTRLSKWVQRELAQLIY